MLGVSRLTLDVQAELLHRVGLCHYEQKGGRGGGGDKKGDHALENVKKNRMFGEYAGELSIELLWHYQQKGGGGRRGGRRRRA